MDMRAEPPFETLSPTPPQLSRRALFRLGNQAPGAPTESVVEDLAPTEPEPVHQTVVQELSRRALLGLPVEPIRGEKPVEGGQLALFDPGSFTEADTAVTGLNRFRPTRRRVTAVGVAGLALGAAEVVTHRRSGGRLVRRVADWLDPPSIGKTAEPTAAQLKRIKALETNKLSIAEMRSHWKPYGERYKGDHVLGLPLATYVTDEIQKRPTVSSEEQGKARIVIGGKDFSDLATDARFTSVRDTVLGFVSDYAMDAAHNPDNLKVPNSLTLNQILHTYTTCHDYIGIHPGMQTQQLPLGEISDIMQLQHELAEANNGHYTSDYQANWPAFVAAAKEHKLGDLLTDDLVAKMVYFGAHAWQNLSPKQKETNADRFRSRLLEQVEDRYPMADSATLAELRATIAELEIDVIEPLVAYQQAREKGITGIDAIHQQDNVGVANQHEGFVTVVLDHTDTYAYEKITFHEIEHLLDGRASVRKNQPDGSFGMREKRFGVGYFTDGDHKVTKRLSKDRTQTYAASELLGPLTNVGYDMDHLLVELAAMEDYAPSRDGDRQKKYESESSRNAFTERSEFVSLLAELLSDDPIAQPPDHRGDQDLSGADYFIHDGGFQSEGYLLLQNMRLAQRDPSNPEAARQARRDFIKWFDGEWVYNDSGGNYIRMSNHGYGPGAWNRLMQALAVNRYAGQTDRVDGPNSLNAVQLLRMSTRVDKNDGGAENVVLRPLARPTPGRDGTLKLAGQSPQTIVIETNHPAFNQRLNDLLTNDWQKRVKVEKWEAARHGAPLQKGGVN